MRCIGFDAEVVQRRLELCIRVFVAFRCTLAFFHVFHTVCVCAVAVWCMKTEQMQFCRS